MQRQIKNSTLVFFLAVGLAAFCSCSSQSEKSDFDSEKKQVSEELEAKIEGLADETESGLPITSETRKDLENDEFEAVVDPSADEDREAGSLHFFASYKKGIFIAEIDWDDALTQSNPGMDCELKHQGNGVYRCLVNFNNETAIVTVRERTVVSKSREKAFRKLNSIVIDSKGKDNFVRWNKELIEAGFKKTTSKKSNSGLIRSYLSKSGESAADLIWNPSKLAVSLVLKSSKAPVRTDKQEPMKSRERLKKRGAKANRS